MHLVDVQTVVTANVTYTDAKCIGAPRIEGEAEWNKRHCQVIYSAVGDDETENHMILELGR